MKKLVYICGNVGYDIMLTMLMSVVRTPVPERPLPLRVALPE